MYYMKVGCQSIASRSVLESQRRETHHPLSHAVQESFFNWFYLAINIGSLIACTVIVYIQDSISWTLGFAIPGACTVLYVTSYDAR